ncbi:MAG: hypothetical protein R3E02_10120 [Blastomonas sp.]
MSIAWSKRESLSAILGLFTMQADRLGDPEINIGPLHRHQLGRLEVKQLGQIA